VRGRRASQLRAALERVSIDLTATVATVDDQNGFLEGRIKPGDTIVGTYTYDLATPDSNDFPTVGDYWHTDPLFGITLSVGGYVFRTKPDNVEFLVEIVNDHNVPPRDNYLLRSYNNILDGPNLTNFAAPSHLAWQLDDDSAKALSSAALTDEPPVLSAWQSIFGLTIEYDSLGFFIRAHVVSVTAGTGTTTSTTTTTVPPFCGDGLLAAGEQCDPGPDDPTDCCSAGCQLLTGVCRSAPDGVATHERGCYFPAFCNGVDAACPANAFRDGEVCVDANVCTPVDFCSAGRCVSGPALCDVSVPSALVVGRGTTIPVTCAINDGGDCRARAFVPDLTTRASTATGAKRKRLCRKPVEGACPITGRARAKLQAGAARVLPLRLNALGRRLLAAQDAVEAEVVADVKPANNNLKLRQRLAISLRR
jgi:cysteine-rich repeat protein